jgi:hypothetical protein
VQYSTGVQSAKAGFKPKPTSTTSDNNDYTKEATVEDTTFNQLSIDQPILQEAPLPECILKDKRSSKASIKVIQSAAGFKTNSAKLLKEPGETLFPVHHNLLSVK